MIRFLAVVAALFTLAPALAQPLPANIDKDNTLIIDTTKGRVVVKLRPDLAPNHVERIKQLARDGYYNNVPFHRVIDGFMAQGGDPTGTGTGGSKLPDLPAEFTNKRRFLRGTCGMARTQDPNSGNSQFFIMFAPYPSLDGKYTIWGQVIQGMEFVDMIKRGSGEGGTVANPDRIVRMRVASYTGK